jgi:photosystem II stability/assembly factor-like uncharacterized protein
LGGTIVHTIDGGKTWTAQASGTERDIYVISNAGSGTLFAAGQYGIILTTTDGGVTWSSLPSTAGKTFHACCFVDPAHGWVGGEDGLVLSTTDGGSTWKNEDLGTANYLYGGCFLNRGTGWIVGEKGTILKYSETGAATGSFSARAASARVDGRGRIVRTLVKISNRKSSAPVYTVAGQRCPAAPAAGAYVTKPGKAGRY